jgi:hypothetical protein
MRTYRRPFVNISVSLQARFVGSGANSFLARGACQELNPVYRRLLKLALEELQRSARSSTLKKHLTPPTFSEMRYYNNNLATYSSGDQVPSWVQTRILERSRAGSSLIAYPVRADMMDPPMVRRNELV